MPGAGLGADRGRYIRGRVARWWKGRHRLGVRLVVSHVALALAPAVGVALLVLGAGRLLHDQAVLEGRRAVAQRVGTEVREYLWHTASGLRAVGLAVGLETDPWHQQSLLSRAAVELRVAHALLVVDSSGVIQATSVLDVTSPLYRGRRLPDGYAPAGYRGLLAAGRDSTVVQAFLGADRPAIGVAVPLRGSQGARAVLVARVDAYALWQQMDRVEVGPGSRVVLLDDQGRYLAHPAREPVYRQRLHPQAARLTGSARGAFRWRDGQGVEWLSAPARVHGLGWTVVVEQPAREAFHLLARTRQWVLLVVCLALLGAGLAGGLLARGITRPLGALMAGVRGLRNGNPAAFPAGRRDDEVGELAVAFQDLAGALAARQGELQEELRFEHCLLESLPVGVAVVEHRTHVVRANGTWHTLLEQGVGDRDLTSTPKGAALARWLQSAPETADVDRFLVDDGRGGVRSWNVRTLWMPGAYAGKALVVVVDRTDKERLERRAILVERSAALGRMAAGVAHEIKNPLAIMQSVCDFLGGLGPHEEAQRREALEALRAAIRRADARTMELLDFARPARPRQDRADLASLTDQLVRLMSHRLEQARVTVHTELGPVPPVRVDPDVLKGVLVNLVSNAVEAMPDGGELHLTAQAAGGEVVLRIQDTGTGIVPEDRERIFEHFFSTKASGYGLGLAMARREVGDAGGRIEVDSQPGFGSVFSLHLPAVRQEDE
ncbi:MAG: ATP-binding protein [Candidatus Latescibacterota bacterium]